MLQVLLVNTYTWEVDVCRIMKRGRVIDTGKTAEMFAVLVPK